MSIQHMQMVFDAEGFTPGEKSVLLAYCNFTDPHGYCWPGVERIADMTGLSERGVKKIRKAFIERDILATASRVNSQGVRTTNITRINLDKLASMRMPEKVYQDNVVHELGFAETTPDQPTGTEYTDPEQPKCTEYTDPVHSVPRKDGALSAPYPSEEPSEEPSSSSARAEDPTPDPTPPAPKKKTKIETSSDIIKNRLTDEHCTTTEADQIARNIDEAGTHTGERIKSLPAWVTNRDINTLRGDLAQVRGHEPTGGGYQPYRNPENQDVYDEALL